MILLAAVSTLVATPAFAADFAGPRVEGRLGFDKTTISLGISDGVDSFKDKGHDSGVNVGVEAGYDAKVGKLVAGVYAGAEIATTKECGELYGNDESCLKMGRNFTLGARLGAAVSPSALLYVKGGYSNGQLKATYEDFADSSFNSTEKANRGGFHFGAGAEFALSASTYVRAEYVRTNYNDYDYSDGEIDLKIDSHRDQAVLGFGLRF